MQSWEIRQKFLDFFEKRGHVVIPSASLVPENDPSVLFTTAGMQQFKPYYLGKKDTQKDFGSLNTVSVQKCIRTSDIEEVGDERHLTFFEMLGNFSFGGYWKREAIRYAYDFIAAEMNLTIDYVTVFGGDENVLTDEESENIWKSIDSNIIVKKFGRMDNFWGPTGEEGPCGPTTEIYIGGIEIWNIVFNEYYQNKNKTLKPLEIRGVDTGMGLERLTMVSQKVPTVFDTDMFSKLIRTLPRNMEERKKRIMTDHLRAISFIIGDGVRPNNKGAGYVLRRLLRRVLAQFNIEHIKLAIDLITAEYGNIYEELNKNLIWEVINEERNQFIVALDLGMKELDKLKNLDSTTAFRLYSSYGLPLDVMRDKFPKLDIEKFEEEFGRHQEISKAGMEQKFKGGLAGTSEMEVKYHTATHLLHQALREVLGKEVFQKGSNITPERLRFDFSFSRKMTDAEKEKVEVLVNKKIKESLEVSYEDLPFETAKQKGAIGLFEERYGDKVRVYRIGEFSLEFCGGPHAENTNTLGMFKIIKEEAISLGIRRIKAILK